VPVLIDGANSLATRFNPIVGCTKSWDNKKYAYSVIIDNMMNLELLFKAHELGGPDSLKDVAISHAYTTMKNHYREDKSTRHLLDYDPETGEVVMVYAGQGFSTESAWARGQAWSIYGFTVAYRFTGEERYLKQAENVADYLLVKEDNMPEDLIPLWDFDVVEFANNEEEMTKLFNDKGAMLPYTETRDVSSACIISSALYELYWHTKNELYKEKADKMIESLSKEPYRAEVGTNGGFIFKHSVGSLPHSFLNIQAGKTRAHNIDVPLNYADYYFLEALLRKGRVEKGENPIK
jgi:hypothetical protein